MGTAQRCASERSQAQEATHMQLHLNQRKFTDGKQMGRHQGWRAEHGFPFQVMKTIQVLFAHHRKGANRLRIGRLKWGSLCCVNLNSI